MSTQVPVPSDLLDALRENVKSELESLANSLSNEVADDRFEEALDELTRAIAVHRALAAEAEAYPGDAVRCAATYTISDAKCRIADDPLSVDEAEFYVGQVRMCEALLRSERQAVTA